MTDFLSVVQNIFVEKSPRSVGWAGWRAPATHLRTQIRSSVRAIRPGKPLLRPVPSIFPMWVTDSKQPSDSESDNSEILVTVEGERRRDCEKFQKVL